MSARSSQEKNGTSHQKDKGIRELGDWRDAMFSKIRNLIKQVDPEIVEETKWRKPSNPAGVPAWSHDGLICTGETYKDHLKLTFPKGASLKDPSNLFNSSLESNARRAIDIHKGETIDEEAFKILIREAVNQNRKSQAC
ncbi:MAG TPA: DUF1801 domain-containing protein [Candidatus Limnocylindrales bacterium]|nr:DUF1801 domain-containing protein [Candidatus Limnocylindrales bacterium]